MTGDTCEGVVEATLLVLAMSSTDNESVAPKTVLSAPPPVTPLAAPSPSRAIESPSGAKHSLPFAVASGLTLAAHAFSEGRWAFDVGMSVAFEWRRGAFGSPWLKPRVALGASGTPFHLTIRSPFATCDYEHARVEHPRLRDEAAFLNIEVLRAEGRRDDARKAAATFLEERPTSLYLKHVRAIVLQLSEDGR
jgi:hypothetical protein